MNKLLLIATMLITSNVWSQTSFEKFDLLNLQGYRAQEKGNYKEALHYYSQAFQHKGLAETPDYLNAAKCAVKLEEIDKAWHYIKDAISLSGIKQNSLINYEEFKGVEPLQRLIEEQYDSLYKIYYQNLPNLNVYLQVEALTARDQIIRKLEDYYLGITEAMKQEAVNLYIKARKKNDTVAMKKHKGMLFPNIEDEFKKYNMKMMNTVDSLNIRELMDITREHGWQKNAWFILWHQRGSYGEDTPVWTFFKSALDKEIATGKLPKSFWAPFEDHKSRSTSGRTKYGYALGKVDSTTVNTNRKSIGLPELTAEEIEQRNQNPWSGRMY